MTSPVSADQSAIIDWEQADNRRFAIEYTAPALTRAIGPPSAGGRVLSVGCGVGVDVEALWELGWDAHGIEPGYRRADWARRRCPERLIQGDGRDLPFEDESFDAITSYGVIEHVGAVGDTVDVYPDVWEQRARYARELTRVLRPGGVMLLSTPNRLFPADFFHSPNRFGMRWHSPREDFSLTYGDLERLFIDMARNRRMRHLSLDRAFVFRRTREHLWGRALVPVARQVMRLMGVPWLKPLARSPINPFLIVEVTK
jgi:SAM-dependent methyltransferase